MSRKGRDVIVRPPAFAYRRAARDAAPRLFCDQVDLARLATRHGTPLYVYSAETIRARLQAFTKAFRAIPHTICYSVKANSTLAILRLVAQQKAGFDVVSGGELERVRRAAPKAAAKVVFSGVGKTVPEIELALKSGILLFNVESASELRGFWPRLPRASRKKLPSRCALIPMFRRRRIRIFPPACTSINSGVPIPEAYELYAEAAKHPNLQVAGVSVHIGSQITDLTSFTDALIRVAELVRELRGAGHDIQYVDAGGGLGIPYQAATGSFAEQITIYADAVLEPLRKLNVHLLLEPGRSSVGSAGVLLTRVIYRKTNNTKRFLIVDAAMNDLLRPSLYGAYHEIVPVQLSPSQEKETSARDNGRRRADLRNRRFSCP